MLYLSQTFFLLLFFRYGLTFLHRAGQLLGSFYLLLHLPCGINCMHILAHQLFFKIRVSITFSQGWPGTTILQSHHIARITEE
jgi:hypothetical protein